MKLRIAGMTDDSIVDGPGLRFTLFLQGCNLACKGCHNPETQDMNGGKEVSIDEILQRIERNPLLSGVTLSGGEPFLQADALLSLVNAIKGKLPSLNIIAYTGYLWEELLTNESYKRLMEKIDIIIDGRYIQEQKSLALKFVGSKNQRVIDVRSSLAEGKVVLHEF